MHMIRKMIHPAWKDTGFVWLDVVNPNAAEIKELAASYKLPAPLLKDCLDPKHLPKFERVEGMDFFVVRAFDEKAHKDADTVQELTRKVAIFSSQHVLISIHRKDQHYFVPLREKWSSETLLSQDAIETSSNSTFAPLYDILSAVFSSYQQPIDDALAQMETFEMSIFDTSPSKKISLHDGYYIKRKGSVFKRVLRLSLDSINRFHTIRTDQNASVQDLKDTLDNMFFYADELLDNTNNLLNLHLTLSSNKLNEASHKTNEVMRFLTIFSVFFMPLNLIAGIYGMNFEFMPEIKWTYGYPAALSLMGFVLLGIYFWFRKKGWMK